MPLGNPTVPVGDAPTGRTGGRPDPVDQCIDTGRPVYRHHQVVYRRRSRSQAYTDPGVYRAESPSRSSRRRWAPKVPGDVAELAAIATAAGPGSASGSPSMASRRQRA